MTSRSVVALCCLGLAACETAPAGPDGQATLTLAVVSGDAQTAAPGAELPEPVVVVVLDPKGRPVVGQLVNFLTLGGGSVFAGSALSDRGGLVREWWTLGPEPGDNTLEARAVDPATGEKPVLRELPGNGSTLGRCVDLAGYLPDAVLRRLS